MRKLIAYSCIALLMLSSGCTLFTSPMERPLLVENYTAKDGRTVMAMAATSDRREVLLYPNGAACMEAPPDVSENISVSLTNQLSASGKTAAAPTISASDSIAHQVGAAVAYAVKPSQGIMLYRNGMSDLCNEWMNRSLRGQFKNLAQLA